MARLDRVKSWTGLVEWYGKNARLRELVHLVVVGGDRPLNPYFLGGTAVSLWILQLLLMRSYVSYDYMGLVLGPGQAPIPPVLNPDPRDFTDSSRSTYLSWFPCCYCGYTVHSSQSVHGLKTLHR
ncbi:hypothetical protein M9H77_11533 [Catharanthus roseus]|uniref:Uncharacterized protein n=1 Tax=Catharanthus roseus TaxID=4058 RepID=A0ACC0BEX4_CATRO|nr:hypothetical protein M9H77_11533 [Catharanthus roseus]